MVDLYFIRASKRNLLITLFLFLVMVFTSFASFMSGPGLPNESYEENQLGSVISQNSTNKAVSSVVMHNGYMFVPLGTDNGGGAGAGAFHIYNVSDLENPELIFNSLDFIDVYHKRSSFDFVGDWAEIHALPIVEKNYFIMSERGTNKAGFSIFDPTGAYDDDSTTLPKIVSRVFYPGVNLTTNYDGYSFSLASYGGKYIYSPTGANGLFITDISDIENPVVVKHIPRSGLSNLLARTATIIGNWLIISDSQVGAVTDVLIMDISDPINPVQVGKIDQIKLGYQPILYGSEFFPIDDGPIISYDFKDPQNIQIKHYNQHAGDVLFNPEYGFGKDDFLFIGHYPGMTKWSLTDIDAPVVSRVQPINPSSDDYAFITPIGNAIVVTSDHNHPNKLNFGVHDIEPDNIAPAVKFVMPQNLSQNVSTTNGFGISFTDFIDPLSIDTSTLYLQKLGSNQKVAGTFSQTFGYVNFYPNEALESNATYQIVLKKDGIKDWVGNGIIETTVVSTFSTGSGVLLLPEIKPTQPSLTQQNITFEIDTLGIGNNTFSYAWDFGDQNTTSFSTDIITNHSYSNVGNFTVTLKIRIDSNTIVSKTATQVIHHPIAENLPVNSSTIIFDEANNLVWNVNPDNNSASAIDVETLQKKYEIVVGQKPCNLAIDNNGFVYVLNKESGSITTIDASNGIVQSNKSLPYGSFPSAIVIDKAINVAYVSLKAKNELLKLSLPSLSIIDRINLINSPKNLALSTSNESLYIGHFISPNDAGKVTKVNTSNFSIETIIDLAIDTSPDGATNGRGLPNYLGALAISPDEKQLYIPSKKDNIQRGRFRDGNDLSFEHTVRSIASKIDLTTDNEVIEGRIDFDNDDFATAVAFTPLGNQILITTNGTSKIYFADAYDPEKRFALSTGGLAPDGLCLNNDGSQIFIHNFMSRSVSVLKCFNNCDSYQNLANIDVVSNEKLTDIVLKGKQLFYNSVDTRLAQDGYMSCASCHLDGGNDGRVWDITSLGEGLRNTIDLRGKQGMSHGRLHWSGNFDEVQDFENQIRDLNSGAGLLSNENYLATIHPLNDPRKTGKSADLDALAAYVNSLDNVLKSPYRIDGELTAQALEGKVIFNNLNCVGCHGGTNFTNSQGNELFDIGTIKPSSGKRLGESLDGFDVPTLRGLWLSPPYLHDGSAPTVADAVLAHNNVSIATDDLEKLVEYLLQIDNSECLTEVGTSCDDGNPRTENDMVTEDCICKGTLLDCRANDEAIYEVWENINGTSVEDFKNHPDYLLQPNTRSILTSYFEAVSPNSLNNFGARLSGIICAPETGNFTFYISGNDATELYLSTDNTIDNTTLIAYNSEPTFFREWDKFESQKSVDIYLEESKQYYIYALGKEGIGNNHLSVGWKMPSGKMELPMRTNYLSAPIDYNCNLTYISDLNIEVIANGLGDVIGIDESNGDIGPNDGSQLSIKGDIFDKGLGVHAYSKVVVPLNNNYTSFSTYIGIQRQCFRNLPLGSVEFEIRGDGVRLYNSPIMYVNSQALYVEVNVVGIHELELIVKSSLLGSSCDHAVWADAKLTGCLPCGIDTSCDDLDSCTINDTFDENCICTGELLDENTNGICDLDEITTSIADNYLSSIKLHPNPTSDVVILNVLKQDLIIDLISVYDINGQLQCTDKIEEFNENQYIIRLEGMAKGIYLIKLQTNKGVITRKIVLQ
jgi:hypothetical protein